MERQLIFRAFDTKLKQMLELDKFWHIFDDGGYSISQSKDYQPDDCIIMQFTGLTDKNGADIYESDVVEYDEFARPCSRDGMRIEVKVPDIYLRINGMKNIKVIGNIHQDKNLLK